MSFARSNTLAKWQKHFKEAEIRQLQSRNYVALQKQTFKNATTRPSTAPAFAF